MEQRWEYAHRVGGAVHTHTVTLDAGAVTVRRPERGLGLERRAARECFVEGARREVDDPAVRASLVAALARTLEPDELERPLDRARLAYLRRYDPARLAPERLAYVHQRDDGAVLGAYGWRLDASGVSVVTEAPGGSVVATHAPADECVFAGPPTPHAPAWHRAALRGRLGAALAGAPVDAASALASELAAALAASAGEPAARFEVTDEALRAAYEALAPRLDRDAAWPFATTLACELSDEVFRERQWQGSAAFGLFASLAPEATLSREGSTPRRLYGFASDGLWLASNGGALLRASHCFGTWSGGVDERWHVLPSSDRCAVFHVGTDYSQDAMPVLLRATTEGALAALRAHCEAYLRRLGLRVP